MKATVKNESFIVKRTTTKIGSEFVISYYLTETTNCVHLVIFQHD